MKKILILSLITVCIVGTSIGGTIRAMVGSINLETIMYSKFYNDKHYATDHATASVNISKGAILSDIVLEASLYSNNDFSEKLRDSKYIKKSVVLKDSYSCSITASHYCSSMQASVSVRKSGNPDNYRVLRRSR